MAQVRHDGAEELPLVTAGDDVALIASFLSPGADTYSAADVLRILLDRQPHPQAAVEAGSARSL